jgi:hypothetical protein
MQDIEDVGEQRGVLGLVPAQRLEQPGCASRGNKACALRWLMATWSPAARLSSVSGAAVKAAEAPWSKVARVLEPHRHTLTIAAARGAVAGPNLLHQ